MLQDRFIATDFSAAQPFSLIGGRYLFAGHNASWSTDTLALQMLGPDGSTYLDIFRAYDTSSAEENEPINYLKKDGVLVLDLAPGAYQFNPSGGSGFYASVTRVPLA